MRRENAGMKVNEWYPGDCKTYADARVTVLRFMLDYVKPHDIDIVSV
jgi:hypothetical protein